MPEEAVLRCLFCGKRLRKQKLASRFSCPGCHALFSAKEDPAGCVIGLDVEDCGTPACCRKTTQRGKKE